MRTLVLGGTGVFGGRLCRLLRHDPLIELTTGARDGAKVEAERFGPLAFDLQVPVNDGRLELVMAGMRLAGATMPRFCWPVIKATEAEEEGRFRFDVEIGLPGIGRLVRYRGTLTSR